MVNVRFPRFLNPSNYIVICVPLKPTGEVGLIGTPHDVQTPGSKETGGERAYWPDPKL